MAGNSETHTYRRTLRDAHSQTHTHRHTLTDTHRVKQTHVYAQTYFEEGEYTVIC